MILEVFVELLLEIVVGIEDFNTKPSLLLADTQSQSEQSLEVGDVETELQSLFAKTNPSLDGPVDILVEVVALVIGVHIMKLKEVEAKKYEMYLVWKVEFFLDGMILSESFMEEYDSASSLMNFFSLLLISDTTLTIIYSAPPINRY